MQLTFEFFDMVMAAMVVGIGMRIALHWWGYGVAVYSLKTGKLCFDSEFVNDD